MPRVIETARGLSVVLSLSFLAAYNPENNGLRSTNDNPNIQQSPNPRTNNGGGADLTSDDNELVTKVDQLEGADFGGVFGNKANRITARAPAEIT